MEDKYFKIKKEALDEIFNLLEDGYHIAYSVNEIEYLTICITNDNGNMTDEEIDDRIFDLMYVEEEE